jgi:transcriptional regulator with PAS, ATPase and Fis domain
VREIENIMEKEISLIKKCNYFIEYQDLELDEEGDEIEDSEGGYYWQDNDGGMSDYFETEYEAVEDCLENMDTTGIKLTASEKTLLAKYQ